jgi:hypothetical protein
MTEQTVSESRIEDTTEDQASDMLAPQFPETPDWVPPVDVSGAAHAALANKFRRWSGWSDASLVLDNPKNHVKGAQSEVGMVDTQGHTLYLNIDKVSLNPNRVLRTVTPFRLRQEAVMTGIMLHEAGHARHSHWREDETPDTPAIHGNGDLVNEQTMRLACLMEEPRIEGLMARDAREIGAARLAWTMRASAAHLLPMTTLSAEPGQQIMDLITSWALRAGRVVSFCHHTSQEAPEWANKFDTFLGDHIEGYLTDKGDEDADIHTLNVMAWLKEMATSTDDRSTFMVDQAREILRVLFPDGEGDGPNAPTPGGSCAMPADLNQQSDEVSEDSDTTSRAAKDLAAVEDEADKQTEAKAESEEPSDQPENDKPPGGGAGVGEGNWKSADFRMPNSDERQYQKDAERFLRGLIAPVESSEVKLTDSPAATVDGAALSAWKAGGQKRQPCFFRQTRRTVLPSPPVDVAILGDISGSMDDLQHAQAVLAWALSAATIDLSNFAGRGQQIRSCMIHWGDKAEVVQHVGQSLPGIREVPCTDGTYALGPAMRLIEKEMPGFLDPPTDGKPINRLIVMFTDWDHSSMGRDDAIAQVGRALQAGVNIVTIAPKSYGHGWRSMLPLVLDANPHARGISSVSIYDPTNPSQVWDEAAKALAHGAQR